MEFVNEIDVETAGDDAQEVWMLSTELFPYEDHGVSYNAREGKEPVAAPRHYPEWDYAIQLERPSWTHRAGEARPRRRPRSHRRHPRPPSRAARRGCGT